MIMCMKRVMPTFSNTPTVINFVLIFAVLFNLVIPHTIFLPLIDWIHGLYYEQLTVPHHHQLYCL